MKKLSLFSWKKKNFLFVLFLNSISYEDRKLSEQKGKNIIFSLFEFCSVQVKQIIITAIDNYNSMFLRKYFRILFTVYTIFKTWSYFKLVCCGHHKIFFYVNEIH